MIIMDEQKVAGFSLTATHRMDGEKGSKKASGPKFPNLRPEAFFETFS